MLPESGFSSKACWKAHTYRRWMCSDIKKGKTFETGYGSVKRRSPDVKRRWDHVNRKPRSKRKRSSECWADRVFKEHRVSENIGTTEELGQVQRTETTSCGLQGWEDGKRKLIVRIRLANRLVELEEGEIPPTPSPERLVAIVDDCDCQEGLSVQSPGTSQLVSKDTEEHSKTCNETVQSVKETDTPVTKSNGLCLSDSNLKVDKTQPADMIDCVRDASPDKKEPSTPTGGKGIVVESDTESDTVELIGQKGDTATSDVKSCEVGSKSTNVEENPHRNDEIYDSVDEPATCSTPSDAIGVANLPESQARLAATPVFSEPHVRVTGTHTSVAPPDSSRVERVSVPCNQVYGLRSFHEPGSRTNLQDFGSMASSLTFMNNSFQASLVNPYRAQLFCGDPLQNEMERLKKHHEQELKMHESRMLQMKSKRDEEIEEVLKKYDILFQDAEAALQHKTVDFHAKFQKVYLSKLVAAGAAILSHNFQEEALTPETVRAASDNVNHLVPNPAQIRSPVIPPSTVAINQASQVLARPCYGGFMDCSNVLYPNVYELRAAARHLQASSSQSFSPSLLFPVANNGEFIQHFPRYSNNN